LKNNLWKSEIPVAKVATGIFYSMFPLINKDNLF